MGNLRFAAALLFVAACGSDHGQNVDAAVTPDTSTVDAKVWMDAPPPMYDFSCMSNPAPAAGSATANITLSGTVQEVSLMGTTPSIDPADGASLTACKAGAANCNSGNKLAGPVTSAGGGNWSLGPVATGMDPLDGYIAMTKTGDRATYVFPPQALQADQDMVPVLTFTTQAFGGLVLFSGLSQSAQNGTLGIAVTDCANTPIDGATVTLKQNGQILMGLDELDAGTLNPMGAGVHLIFDVPPLDTEVSATYNSMPLLAHTIKVFAGA